MMADEADELELLITTPTEVEASMITGALEDHGVTAVATGGYTSGFKAEAPGAVKVFVKRADIETARRAMEQIRKEKTDVDWSQVDVGEAEQ
jgi:hypothetical protein